MTVMSIDVTKYVDRRTTTTVSIALGIVLLIGGISIMSESPPKVASAVAQTNETAERDGNPCYYPNVYLNQGAFDATEPPPTF
jgi:hypothetical protein